MESETSNPVGRPPKYSCAEDMEKGIEEYFAQCKEDKEPYTVSGLAYHLGMSTEAFRNYENKDEFLATVKRAKQRVEIYLETRLYAPGPVGAIFNLKNNFGWKDKTEVQQSGGLAITAIERVIVDPAKEGS